MIDLGLTQKRLAIICSIVLHLGLVVLFFCITQNARLSGLWSGGLGTGGGRLAYVDVRGLGEVANDAVPNTHLDNKKGVSLKNTIHEPVSKTRVQNSDTMVFPASGAGQSDTPAGGAGAGLDSLGFEGGGSPGIVAQIRKKIMQRQKYPVMAKENGWTGTVRLQFRINQGGGIGEVLVLASSGYRILDEAAAAAIRAAAPLPYFPKAIALALEYRLEE